MRAFSLLALPLSLLFTSCVDQGYDFSLPDDDGGGIVINIDFPSPVPVDPFSLTVVPAAVGDQAQLFVTAPPRLPIALGGTGMLRLVRGNNLVGDLSVTVEDEAPAVEARAGTDRVLLDARALGAAVVVPQIATSSAHYDVEVAEAARAIARPATVAGTLFRADWSDAARPAVFVAAPELPITIGLVDDDGGRVIDLSAEILGAPSGVEWTSTGFRTDVPTVANLPVGTSHFTVGAGGVNHDLAVEVVAAADAIALTAPHGACTKTELLVCASARAGGRDVIAYDWTFTAIGDATAGSHAYRNCTMVQTPAPARAVTLDVSGGHHTQRITIPFGC